MSWTMRKRSRTRANSMVQFGVGYSTVHQTGGPLISESYIDSPYMLFDFMRQETVDVDRKVHPRNKDSKDYGGPFSSKKLEIHFDRVKLSGGITYDYYGQTYHNEVDGYGTILNASTNSMLTGNASEINSMWSSFSFPTANLADYGAKAINLMDPTRNIKGVPDAAQFIFELIREGIPKIPGKLYSRTASLKSAGSEYLNAVFGWKPILTDLSGLLHTYLDISETLKQLRRDNGQNVRRSGTLYYNKVIGDRSPLGGAVGIDAYPGSGMSAFVAGDPPPYGPFETWEETEERVWFAGKGSYILPVELLAPTNDQIYDFIDLLARVPSPSTVYELIPWTWLIDYFTNLGTIVDNAIGKGVGEYTLDYCYLMRKKTVKTYYACTNLSRSGFSDPWATKKIAGPQSRTAQCVVTRTTKERIAASPFGFAVSFDGLSPRRMAILTALGLSRQNFI